MASPISLDRVSTAAVASWNAVAPSRTAITARMTTEQSPLVSARNSRERLRRQLFGKETIINVMSREIILKMLLENWKADYDYIIIDCMPSLGMLTVNALAACDSVLIPATAQYLSAKGLELLLQTIAKVKKRINPQIRIDGILITMFSDRTKISKEILNLMNDAYSEHIRIFDSKIPVSVKVGEANYRYKSVIEYDPKSKVALAYQDFGKEYLSYGNER